MLFPIILPPPFTTVSLLSGSANHRAFEHAAFPLGRLPSSVSSQFKRYFLRKASPELPGTFPTSHPCFLSFVVFSSVLNYTCC